MKVVIFAGGVGTRLWPLSRKNSPKQFEKIIGDKSTLQETVSRLLPEFSYHDIHVATGKRYEKTVHEQLPEIPLENFIFEPDMRDVGPAIGLVSVLMEKRYGDEPVAILWSDHMVKNVRAFKTALLKAEEAITSKKSQFVFIAQKARFANQNMGWIEVGDEKEDSEGVKLFDFKKLYYRPKLSEAIQYYENKNYVWNLGYFVTTPPYLSSMYKEFLPDMYEKLQELQSAWGTENYEERLNDLYPKFEKISFDDAILVKMKSDNKYTISADLGWSDVGAWESLKEAISETQDENVVKGKTSLEDCRDSLVYNYNDQLLVGIDLEGMLVVNTGDVILVCPKTSVPKIKKLVESLAGTEHESLA